MIRALLMSAFVLVSFAQGAAALTVADPSADAGSQDVRPDDCFGFYQGPGGPGGEICVGTSSDCTGVYILHACWGV